LTASEGSCNHLLLLVTELEFRVQSLTAEAQASESSHEDRHNRLQQAEEHLAEITRADQNIESERDSLLPSLINPALYIDAGDHPLVATDAIHNHYATPRTVIVAWEGQSHSLITESPRYLKYPAFGTTVLHGTLEDLLTTCNTLS
jgi:hypothetical protein